MSSFPNQVLQVNQQHQILIHRSDYQIKKNKPLLFPHWVNLFYRVKTIKTNEDMGLKEEVKLMKINYNYYRLNNIL